MTGHIGIVSTKEIMDTNNRSIKAVGNGRGRYRRHSLEFKRRVVEQTLLPGVSVSRIAREHGVNANQVFNWRKLYREGLLAVDGAAVTTLLPVTVTAETGSTTRDSVAPGARSSASRMWLESPKGCLSIEGNPDPAALRQVLEHLLK